MNCVDKFNQNKKSYQIDRKLRKWWHRIFFFFFDATIVNAHAIYNELSSKKLPMKEFRREILNDLMIFNYNNLQKLWWKSVVTHRPTYRHL